MKNIGIYTIIVILLLASAMFFYVAEKKRKSLEAKEKEDAAKKPLANQTQTVVVDPSTKDEIIVSDFGENNADMRDGTQVMESRVADIVAGVSNRTGLVPNQMEFKVYGANGEVVGGGTFQSLQYKR